MSQLIVRERLSPRPGVVQPGPSVPGCELHLEWNCGSLEASPPVRVPKAICRRVLIFLQSDVQSAQPPLRRPCAFEQLQSRVGSLLASACGLLSGPASGRKYICILMPSASSLWDFFLCWRNKVKRAAEACGQSGLVQRASITEDCTGAQEFFEVGKNLEIPLPVAPFAVRAHHSFQAGVRLDVFRRAPSLFQPGAMVKPIRP